MKQVKEGGGGKKFANLLANELETTGNSYALIVLNQSPVFASFKAKRFKQMVANSGIQYVVDNVKGL